MDVTYWMPVDSDVLFQWRCFVSMATFEFGSFLLFWRYPFYSNLTFHIIEEVIDKMISIGLKKVSTFILQSMYLLFLELLFNSWIMVILLIPIPLLLLCLFEMIHTFLKNTPLHFWPLQFS